MSLGIRVPQNQLTESTSESEEVEWEQAWAGTEAKGLEPASRRCSRLGEPLASVCLFGHPYFMGSWGFVLCKQNSEALSH